MEKEIDKERIQWEKRNKKDRKNKNKQKKKKDFQIIIKCAYTCLGVCVSRGGPTRIAYKIFLFFGLPTFLYRKIFSLSPGLIYIRFCPLFQKV